MKILMALTYYRPHVSGLTIYVERLSRALAERGHAVTVLTSRYDNTLPREEVRDGVRVLRIPVLARVSKGVIMPTFGLVATRLVRDHEVLSLHLPQLDAAGLAVRGRLLHRPTVLTYHCDLQLPQGLFNRVVDRVVYVANYLSATLSDRIVAYTQDYADSSPLLSRFRNKITVIRPPVVMAGLRPIDAAAFRKKHKLDGRPVVGMATRLATEKGVEYLLDALPRLLKQFPDMKVLFAGQYQNVLGETAYYERLRPLIEEQGERWEFLGNLAQAEMPAFFASLDALVVPSSNSTESFGMVQVEAMLCGTPVVASDLPGVRQPVRMSGMGEIIPPRDSAALADAVIKVVASRAAYVRPRKEIEDMFSLDRTVTEYERLFGQLLSGR